MRLRCGPAAIAALVLAGGASGALGQDAAPADGAATAPPEATVPATPAPVPAPRIASFRAPRAIAYGDTATVTGRVAPAAVTTIVIERRQGERWVALTTVRSDRRGHFRAELSPRADLSLRARPRIAEAEAGPRRNLNVRRRVTLSVSTHEYESIAGLPFQVAGTVVPARTGERVVVEGSRDGGSFRPLGRFTVRSGRIAGQVRPTAGGTWRFRVSTAAAQPDRSPATAPRAVFGANPHAVPASAPVYLVQKLSEMRLFYYERGQLKRVFPVVFGKPSTPTPIGTFRVYSKTPGPGPAFGPLAIWYHGNYGIHGTNQEYLLKHSWRYYSKGCTRNYNRNIYWLYDRVPIGTPVRSIR